MEATSIQLINSLVLGFCGTGRWYVVSPASSDRKNAAQMPPGAGSKLVPSVAENGMVFEGLTVKDLKLIILLLAEEVFHCDRDVVLRLHPHQPGAGLELWVASRVALAEDHARGVCQKLIGWAVYWEKERDAMYMTGRQDRAGRSACPRSRSITANLVLGRLNKSSHSLSECSM